MLPFHLEPEVVVKIFQGGKDEDNTINLHCVEISEEFFLQAQEFCSVWMNKSESKWKEEEWKLMEN